MGSSSTGCLIWKWILKGLKVQRAGLHIGEFKKQRFEPIGILGLALALKLSEAKNVVKLTWDDPQTNRLFQWSVSYVI